MNADQERSQPLWSNTRLPQGRPLSSNLKTDLLVIGAGIAGVSIAYELAQTGREVVLVDRGSVGGGMTARTSAHLSWEIDDFYFRVVEAHGEGVARRYFESQKAALDRIEALCSQERIGCDFARVDLFYVASDRDGRAKLDKEQRILAALGIDGVSLAESPLAGEYREALRFTNQARFHPLRYTVGVARAFLRSGGQIFSNTAICKISETQRGIHATADNGSVITAKAVVTATNTPIANRVAIHSNQAPYRSYVFAAPVAKGTVPDALIWDTDEPYHYVRLQPGADSDLVIVGGEDHKTGETDDAMIRRDRLYNWARERFPKLGPIENFWSGQIFEPVDYLPFIGRSPNHKRVFFVSGDSGEGLTTAVAASLMLPNLLAGKGHPWARAYSPTRAISRPSVVVTYAKDFVGAMKHVAEHFVPGAKTAESLQAGEGAIVTEKAKKIAAYRDDRGLLHKCMASCTHAGCVVQWNSFERCWDCPCHGSQFTPDGQVLNGPAVKPLPKAPAQRA
jgi:glycine/D-amino acid oxidase-like deaminating enzyme/nitrite reductase/ring-hydroxylating ferredoxin subunit